MFFTPKWKKEARETLKGATQFIHFKRDLLSPEKIAEIEQRRKEVATALREKNREKTDAAIKFLQVTCERSLRLKPQNKFQENVESLFVTLVIVLGLRTFIVQPFRIPTSSMQPTLNGIIATYLPEEDWPSAPKRAFEAVAYGRGYSKIVAPYDIPVRIGRLTNGMLYTPNLQDYQKLHFFSRSQLKSNSGQIIEMPTTAFEMYSLGFNKALEAALQNGGIIPRGTVLCEGYSDAGDVVLVDRVTYHFRNPKRSEVFVFDTRGIEGTRGANSEQSDGTFYIKRLGGVPGDTISVRSPYLIRNGNIAEEAGFQKVYKYPLKPNPSTEGLGNADHGYAYANPSSPSGALLTDPEKSLHLAKNQVPPYLREYVAFGDNSGNSLDSRYWGTVKQFNLVGPAAFTLYPFTKHWGIIR